MSAQIPFHPLSNMFPLMEGEEFDALVEDIRKNGQREPIVLYQGKILDGRNRYRACLAAGVGLKISKHEDDRYIGDAVAYVVSKNIHRRHLTAEQKRELLVKIIASAPEKSDRQHAKEIGVDHKTVGAARAKGEDVGSIPHVETRADTKGRQQPAHKGPLRVEEARERRKKYQEAATLTLKREQQRKEWRASISDFADKLIRLDINLAHTLHIILAGSKSVQNLWDDLDERLANIPEPADDDNGGGGAIDPDASAAAMKAKFAEADAEGGQ